MIFIITGWEHGPDLGDGSDGYVEFTLDAPSEDHALAYIDACNCIDASTWSDWHTRLDLSVRTKSKALIRPTDDHRIYADEVGMDPDLSEQIEHLLAC